MNPKAFWLPAAMLIFCAIPAAAHHSFAMFDRDKTVEMQGTVKAFQWTNPHSFLDVYVEDLKGGAPVLWTLEFGSVHNLVNQGAVHAASGQGRSFLRPGTDRDPAEWNRDAGGPRAASGRFRAAAELEPR